VITVQPYPAESHEPGHRRPARTVKDGRHRPDDITRLRLIDGLERALG
jgi:hypothetical protein